MSQISLRGVKQNNLKNIDVDIPIGKLSIVCGPSGSGKSSLAFESLYAEGQRRYISSLSNYTKQFIGVAKKPDIEEVYNIPPALAIEQKNNIRTSRSTVGTTTEIIDYLRLLYEKIGKAYCPEHDEVCEKQSVSEATEKILKRFTGKRGYLLAKISASGRIEKDKKLHRLLLQEGYLRILVPQQEIQIEGKNLQLNNNEIIDISTKEFVRQGLPEQEFYLVIDRLAFQEKERERIFESIMTAYDAGVTYDKEQNVRNAYCLTTEGELLLLSEELSCPLCDYTPPPITTKSLNFNSPVGACKTCNGFGNILDIDEKKIVPNPHLSIEENCVQAFSMPSTQEDQAELLRFCKKSKISIKKPWKDLPDKAKKEIWEGSDRFYGVQGFFAYLEQKKYKMHVRIFLTRYKSPFQCPSCKGSRLNEYANQIRIHKKSIVDLCRMTIEELYDFFQNTKFKKSENAAAREVIQQLKDRLQYLLDVGVHYLSLDRESKSLSGGEFQRIQLAKQLGMGLSQTLYVLDEPTVGLHPRDNLRLIEVIKNIQKLGNTVVVVEHDRDFIENADHILELGPGSGYLGGELMYAGSFIDFKKNKQSLTNSYLEVAKLKLKAKRKTPKNYKNFLELKEASGNNLKNVDLKIPLQRLVCITGVSGSGKSTLISNTLYPALVNELKIDSKSSLPYKELKGFDSIDNVQLLDQSPVGKSARSNAVTYLKVYDIIRKIFASQKEAKAKKYSAGTFSLNVEGGRCPDCQGLGFQEIDMVFMDNIMLTCETCKGKRFQDEVLEVRYQGKNIYEVLKLTVAEAMNFFTDYPNIRNQLSFLKEVGLDYIQLGQSTSTFSGGETQRLKIARELSKAKLKNNLYILDEPTTGLHFREVDLLMKVLHKLVDAGNSILVIEHNMEVIRECDYLVDIGPEAGHKGGNILFQGPIEEILNVKESKTAPFL